jgi:predicted transcriptional regulator
VTGKSQDELVVNSLQALGVNALAEWDALEFLFNHSATLATVAEIARLMGREKSEIGIVFRKLEALGLIQRSRISQGIRFYRFRAPPESSLNYSCLLELISVAQDRAGRLLLLKHLRGHHTRPHRGRDSGLQLQIKEVKT